MKTKSLELIISVLLFISILMGVLVLIQRYRILNLESENIIKVNELKTDLLSCQNARPDCSDIQTKFGSCMDAHKHLRDKIRTVKQ